MLQELLLHVMLMLINIYEDNSLLAQAELIHTLLLRPNIPVIIVTRLATTTVHVTPPTQNEEGFPWSTAEYTVQCPIEYSRNLNIEGLCESLN